MEHLKAQAELEAKCAELRTDNNAIFEKNKKLNKEVQRLKAELCDKKQKDLYILNLEEQLKKLETCLEEIAKSPQYRHVPNWVVIKIERVLKC